jgi:hypothetical protein
LLEEGVRLLGPDALMEPKPKPKFKLRSLFDEIHRCVGRQRGPGKKSSREE